MSDSMFNADEFLSNAVTGALSTKRDAIPEIEDALLVIKKLDVRLVGQDAKPVLDVTCVVDDETAREATGLSEPTVRHTCWLDIDEMGSLSMEKGKNIDLGKLREAVGQNEDGVAWAPANLIGAAMRGKVTQRPDDKDPTKIYNDVAAIRAI